MKRSHDEISSNTNPATRIPISPATPVFPHDPSAPNGIGGIGSGQAISSGAFIQTTPHAAQPPPVPRISRKIRACTECKKQKVKCDMPAGQLTCTRCSRQKLECVVNRSLQTILDDDVEWKAKLNDDSAILQRAVNDILFRLQMPPLGTYHHSEETTPTYSGDNMRNSSIGHSGQARVKQQHHDSPASLGHQSSSQPTSPHGTLHLDPQLQTRGSLSHSSPIIANSQYNQHGSAQGSLTGPSRSHLANIITDIANSPENLDEQEEETGLATAPMGSLYEVTKLQNLRSNANGSSYRLEKRVMSDDFISKGIISLQEAEELFQTFDRSLNHYLWGGIALVHNNLTSVRQSSSLLSSAIFTVSALHLPQKYHLFDRCYEEFLAIVAASMFDRFHSLDDIRAFCIGAFWLSEISWRLSSHASRIATELNLHQAFPKAMAGSEEHYERCRLWYLLYVCDHHFSIAYGRPPVICEDTTIRNYEMFLKSPLAKPCDERIISQVAIFVVLSRMYDAFGPDMDVELTPENLVLLRQFNLDLDNWKANFQHRLSPNEYVLSYPAKGVYLHYHFAKLQLNCLSLRGVTRASIHNLSTERKEFANCAIDAAAKTLKLVLEEPDIRDSLVGVPLYIHTMIAFAAVFLMKIATKWKSIGFSIEPPVVWQLVEQVIDLLNRIEVSERHLIFFIAVGLEKMLKKCKEWENHKDMEDSLLWDALLRAGGVTPDNIRTHNFMPNTQSDARMQHQQQQQQQQQQHQQQQTGIDNGEMGYEQGTEVAGYATYGTQVGAVQDMTGHGAGMMYDQNYFPMGIYDFLTTQMPG